MAAGGGLLRSAGSAPRSSAASDACKLSAPGRFSSDCRLPAALALWADRAAVGARAPKMESSAQAGIALRQSQRWSARRQPCRSRLERATPFPAATAQATGYASRTLTEGALAKAPQAAPRRPLPSIETIRHAVGSRAGRGRPRIGGAVAGRGRVDLDGASLRIEVAGMGKKMLALTVNAAAEKIIRQELQRLGAPTRFLVVPGEGDGAAPPRRWPRPLAGSIQEAALANPSGAAGAGDIQGRGAQRRRSAAEINARSQNEEYRAMINPLKISEMLSQANQMQEEVQRKLARPWSREPAAAAP